MINLKIKIINKGDIISFKRNLSINRKLNSSQNLNSDLTIIIHHKM